ncbi:MAG: class I SAM-dependent methyltransferase [Nitrospirae bacterium]|nr:class I SAM-dependent methyltransferase [Nitrospirota bacterium]
MQLEKTEIIFRGLPYWKGVQSQPGIEERIDLCLGWDDRGFIRQTTPENVLNEVLDAYSKKEYSFITAPPGLSTWANRLGEEKLAFIKKACHGRRNKVYLEIGAGSLYIAKRIIQDAEAAKYIVVDPAISDESEDARIHIIKDYFSELIAIEEDVDIMIALNCLEHVSDPVDFLMQARSLLLKSKGRLLLSVPDVERMFSVGDVNAVLHEHISYFTENTLLSLLQRCGFNTLLCEKEADSLKVVAEPDDTTTIDVGVAGLQADECFTKATNAFSKGLCNLKHYLDPYALSGVPVAFHGANNGLNNALALAAASENANFWVFDSDESKCGRYLPALRNPIRHSLDPFYKSMDAVFVSATAFFSEIRDFLVSSHGIKEPLIKPLYPIELYD